MKVNSKKRGFTIVELVVAMTIIVIVSATAIALINTQNTIHLRTMQTIEATNMAENAIECFRYVDSVDEFETAYAKTGVTVQNKTTDNAKTTFSFEESNMNVTITVTSNELTFVATDITDSSKVILQKSYMK